MIRQVAYKYRCYPTPEQAELLIKTFGCVRFVYNYMLRCRTDGWHNGQRINFEATCKELTKIKATPELSWLKEVSSVALQQSLRHLQAAFENFFFKRAKYPTFKKKHGKQSATFANNAFRYHPATRSLMLAKMSSSLKIRWSRALPFIPIFLTVSKDRADRYFVAFHGELEINPLPKNNKAIGIDFGLYDFAVTSDGGHVQHPKYLKRYQARLKMLQQRLSRRMKNGKNWERTRQQIAKLYAKISDCRHNLLHQFTTHLIKQYGHIITEDLAIRNMVKNHRLAGAISDSAWNEAIRQFTYKSVWYDRLYTQIDRFFPSSKRCHVCGHILDHLDLSVRVWTCSICGTVHQRDENASQNILAVGLTASMYGQGIRLPKGFPVESTLMRTNF
jgi:putative transposase